MAGIRLDYKIDDSSAVAMLERLEDFDFRAMFDAIGGHLDTEVSKRFKEGKDPEGNAWEDLSEITLFHRIGGASSRKKRGGTKIGAIRKLAGASPLVDHGHLRDSITHKAYSNGTGVEQGVLHGSAMKYAAIHQFGGKAGRGRKVTIPARPFVGINADDEAAIDDIIADHIQRALQ